MIKSKLLMKSISSFLIIIKKNLRILKTKMKVGNIFINNKKNKINLLIIKTYKILL